MEKIETGKNITMIIPANPSTFKLFDSLPVVFARAKTAYIKIARKADILNPISKIKSKSIIKVIMGEKIKK
jgi:hypothetical protein